jgi:serine/threonine protein kinase
MYTKPFEESSAYVVMRQISMALAQIHQKNILHLDLKEANILITYDEGNSERLECAKVPVSFLIADFGVSKDLQLTKPNELVTYHRGTLKYMAPEQNIVKQVKDVKKVEVFQLGVILFRLFYKAYPFTQSSHEDAQVRNPNFLEDFESSSRNVYKVFASTELK